MSNEETSQRPTHRVYAVTKQGDKKFWQRIGALWSHADGKGFNQRLDYLPLNGADIVVRSVEDDPQAAEPANTGARSVTGGKRRPALKAKNTLG